MLVKVSCLVSPRNGDAPLNLTHKTTSDPTQDDPTPPNAETADSQDVRDHANAPAKTTDMSVGWTGVQLQVRC